MRNTIKLKLVTIIALFALFYGVALNAGYVQPPFSVSKGGTGSSSQSASKAVTTDGSGNIVSTSATTSAQIGFLSTLASDVQTQINGKFATPAGATSQYVRGNGSLATLDTSVVPENGNLYHTNARTIASLLTAYSAGAGTVSSSDSILAAIQKIDGNDALKLPTASFTDAAVTGKLITGFSASAGTVAATDTILQAFNKIVGNIAALPTANTIVNGGNAAYSILAGQDVRAGTTLTSSRTYTLPLCTGSNPNEKHNIKNPPAQTFTIVVAAAGSDNIDGASNYTLNPGDSVSVSCGAFSTNGTWDIN